MNSEELFAEVTGPDDTGHGGPCAVVAVCEVEDAFGRPTIVALVPTAWPAGPKVAALLPHPLAKGKVLAVEFFATGAGRDGWVTSEWWTRTLGDTYRGPGYDSATETIAVIFRQYRRTQ